MTADLLVAMEDYLDWVALLRPDMLDTEIKRLAWLFSMNDKDAAEIEKTLRALVVLNA